MKKSFIIGLMVVFGLGLSACNKDTDSEELSTTGENNLFMEERLAVKEGDSWGYLDAEGSPVIEMQYEGAGRFKEGVALVEDSEGYKLIDESQEVLAGPYPYMERDEETGLIWFIENSKVGLMDELGETLIEPVYDHYYQYDESYFIETEFSEGIALVMIDGDYGLINDSGESMVEVGDLISDIGPFNSGRATFYDYDTSKSGFVDTEGNIVIEARFDFARAFDAFGRAIVTLTEDGVRNYYLIDTSGDFIIEKAVDIDYTDHGYLVHTGGAYYFADEDGERFHEDDFTSVSGVAWSIDGFYLADGQIVDAKGNVLHETDEGVDDYVQDGDVLYLVESHEAKVTLKSQDASYEITGTDVEQVSGTLAVMKQGEQYGVVNFDDEIIVPFDYDGALVSHDGFILVLDSEEMIGLYKMDGTKVFDCIYEEMNLSLNP